MNNATRYIDVAIREITTTNELIVKCLDKRYFILSEGLSDILPQLDNIVKSFCRRKTSEYNSFRNYKNFTETLDYVNLNSIDCSKVIIYENTYIESFLILDTELNSCDFERIDVISYKDIYTLLQTYNTDDVKALLRDGFFTEIEKSVEKEVNAIIERYKRENYLVKNDK